MKTITPDEYRRCTRKKGRPRFHRSPPEDRTLDGITFPSIAEMMRYAELTRQFRAGQTWFIRQPLFDLAGVKYHADFLIAKVILGADGKEHLAIECAEEVKGHFRGAFRDEALRGWKRNAEQVKQLYGIPVVLIER